MILIYADWLIRWESVFWAIAQSFAEAALTLLPTVLGVALILVLMTRPPKEG